MDDPRIGKDIFPWSSDGVGMHVQTSDPNMLAHEVLFEDGITAIKDTPMFLGKALPIRRYTIAMAVVGLAVAILLGRAFWMQVVQGPYYQSRAEDNRTRHESIDSRRGVIRDRTGIVLAENTPDFDLRTIPWYLPADPDARNEMLAQVGRTAGVDVASMQAIIASSTDPTESLSLMRDVPYDRALSLQVLVGDDPGVHIVTGNKRSYPESAATMSLSHVLGYTGVISPEEYAQRKPDGYRQTDLVGKAGIEASYEDVLRGTPGERIYEVDARNKIMSIVGERQAVDGRDVRLSLDLGLQRIAEQALRKELQKLHLGRGAAIAMDPRDGSILALVSLPAYDNNLFAGSVSSTAYKALLTDPDHPLLPRAYAGTYPSGSVIKPAYATAALAEGVITANTTVDSVGGIRIGATFFPDWKAGGHGITNVRKAIAWSVNTFFYYIGGGYDSFIGLGVDRMVDWLQRFGMGSRTGIDVPGERPGFVPSAPWKEQTKGERWYVGDTYNLSIGQGDLLVTPLQIATYICTIANGGYAVRPHLVSAFIGADGSVQTVSDPPSTKAIADPFIIQTVRAGMRDTVVYGSGHSLSTLPFPVAGKTGTAQWRNDKPTHAWFTSFAPYDKPEIVVTVLIEEGGEGSISSIPVAREILSAWYAEKQSK